MQIQRGPSLLGVFVCVYVGGGHPPLLFRALGSVEEPLQDRIQRCPELGKSPTSHPPGSARASPPPAPSHLQPPSQLLPSTVGSGR